MKSDILDPLIVIVAVFIILGGGLWYLETYHLFILSFPFLKAASLSAIIVLSGTGCGLIIYWTLVNLRICMPAAKTWFDHLIFFKGLWPIQKRRGYSRSKIMAQRLREHAHHEERIDSLKEATQRDNEKWGTTFLV